MLIKKLRHGPAQFLAHYFEKKGEAFFRSKEELWQAIERFMTATGVSGCSFSDYYVLYTHIKNKKPKHILECGSGVSTLIMAHALLENKKEGHDGRLTSLEEDPSYYQKIKAAIPPRYGGYITLLQSKAVEKRFDFFRGSSYENVPDHPYDFVFIDGPYFLSDPQIKGELAFNFDFLEIVQKSAHPVTAIIDTRSSTCYVYRLLFGKKFYYDYVRKLGIIKEVTQKDIRDAKKIVTHAMRKRFFKRPPFLRFLRGEY